MMLSGQTAKKSQPTFPKNRKAPQSSNSFVATEKGSQYFISSQEICGFPIMSAAAESLFSISGNVITKPRDNLSPAKKKMLADLKNEDMKLRLCDFHMSIESGDAGIDDDPDLYAQINWVINDNSDHIIRVHEDEDHVGNCFDD